MFRNPRENSDRAAVVQVPPSVGRPPSPPTFHGIVKSAREARRTPMPAATTLPKLGTYKPPSRPQNGKTTPGRKLNSPGSGMKGKPNGSILSFFKKEEQGLFFEDNSNHEAQKENLHIERSQLLQNGQDQVHGAASGVHTSVDERFHENGGSVKKRRVDDLESAGISVDVTQKVPGECSPPPPATEEKDAEPVLGVDEAAPLKPETEARRQRGPFVDDSDSEEEAIHEQPKRKFSSEGNSVDPIHSVTLDVPCVVEHELVATENVSTSRVPAQVSSGVDEITGHDRNDQNVARAIPLNREATSYSNLGDFEDFDAMEDSGDEGAEDQEYYERRYLAEQRRIELAEAGFEGDTGGFDDYPDEELLALADEQNMVPENPPGAAARCPICDESLADVSDHEASVHVNNCLDGNPSPLPKSTAPIESKVEMKLEQAKPRFRRPAKPGQDNPIVLGASGSSHKSAFSALMSGHAEDAAWATAAAAEHASRGKPAFQRTCPFYKIMPGMFICVDAFRYGGVQDCKAYFLSHFHSDHYIGLTSSWSHGPIYCSHVTANLVRQQLRVDPKYVVDLEFEQKAEVPGTSVSVTMISANHCPGSSLFLFEKAVGKGKIQRILHCGDFRACRAHVEHPLLKPEVVDNITGKTLQQKIDVCYLDTTYLNPKYAFPSQEEVIKACADMCVSLNKVRADESDGWEQMKRDRAGAGMVKFVNKEPNVKQEEDLEAKEVKPEPSHLDAMSVLTGPSKPRGRLLVVVGTYSIGKERICLGIAEALDSKIYAPPSKQRICACLEDPRLNSRLTSDPRAAQVHMTPLFEIRADTLEDYLKDFRDVFSRAVGFRPTGWNYRPPNSRFTESPAVQTVLKSQNWRSTYAMKDLMPQRGSTSRASCFGVPYSEHSSFRELTMFCCALRIEKVVPTVNVGNAKSRERMKQWVERWMVERRKNGLFKPGQEGCEW